MRIRPTTMRSVFSVAAALLLISLRTSPLNSQPTPTWLDRPLTNWNTAGMPVPITPAGSETPESILKRCQLKPPRETMAERAIESASWMPFWHVDQQLIRDDIEVLGGMRAADEACLPATYHLFVFVEGRFAGTLSPAPMSSRRDGSAGAVRLSPPLISAEFARYAENDPPCCPSSRVTVRYRVDRLPAGPVVVPIEVRTTRP